jgi:phosphoglycerate dehydrogenase-like enzyme
VRPSTDRARRRVDAERQIRAFARRHRVRETILRAPGIWAFDRVGGDPRERVRRGEPSLAAADDVVVNHVHADDLARACVLALMRGPAPRTLNAVDDDPRPVGERGRCHRRPARAAAAAADRPGDGARPALADAALVPLGVAPCRQRTAEARAEAASPPPGHRRDNRRRPRTQRSRTAVKILVAFDPMPNAPLAAALRARAPELDVLEHGADVEDRALAEVEALVAWRMPRGLLARLPRLGWICSAAAGVEKLLVPDLPAHVRVSRIVDPEQAAGIAQFVVLMALRHARDLPRYEALQRERRWERQPTPGARHRAVVLGTGAMGGAIVEGLRSVGFPVTGWNRRSPTSLHGVLAGADLCVCALPLTAETDGILDAAAFAAMPAGGYLINVARGAHVVEADLIEAVRSGRLSGAALDVQVREPMGSEDPLWSVPGITITPHIAAQSSIEVVADQVAAAARAVRAGGEPLNAVDRARGY